MKSDIEIRRIAEGLALPAYPKWKQHGVRIANHSFKFDSQHYEWLTIIGQGGRMKILQHHPTPRVIGQLSANDLEKLIRPIRRGFRGPDVRGHIRREIRRKR